MLKPSCLGGSNMYLGSLFCAKNKNKIKNMNKSFNFYSFKNLFISGRVFIMVHQENMSMQCIPPYNPLLYSKTGIWRGIPVFRIFAPKHRLWVLVRTASSRRF